MCWHPKAAPLVKYAYQIFHGSINTNNPTYNPKLQEVLQLTKQCLICWLNNKEWVHPKGIIVAGHQGGCCSTKIADTLVPQMGPNIVNLAETFGVETNSIKVLQWSPDAKLPSKATEGSAAYDLFPLAQETIPPHSCQLISTGLSIEINPSYYSQISSQSSLSSKHLLDIAARVINSNYRGVLKILLHNHSDQLFSVTPEQAITQILFLPLCSLPLEDTWELSTMKRGTHRFGSTDIKSFQAKVIQLKPAAGQPPSTTFLGAQPSKATVRLDLPDSPQTQIVIDSGSNITLVSLRLLDQLPTPPKPKEGQSIKINQVTRQSSTSQYITLDIHFETSGNPVSIRLEAYVVKDMNAPIITGKWLCQSILPLHPQREWHNKLETGQFRILHPSGQLSW